MIMSLLVFCELPPSEYCRCVTRCCPDARFLSLVTMIVAWLSIPRVMLLLDLVWAAMCVLSIARTNSASKIVYCLLVPRCLCSVACSTLSLYRTAAAPT